jgi:eukaryotic-like serine/threonine-protein kinase
VDANRWQRLQDLFFDALERDPSSRAAFLHATTRDDPTLRDEIAAMLAAHDDNRRLDSEAHRDDGATPASEPAARIAGRDVVRAGPYRLLERIGRGGMGEVFRAERDDGQYTQTVAIKVIRAGFVTPELLRRFRAERQILARLQHAGIARLLDGAVADDGQPYLAMEYVAGRSITDYCDAARLGVEARLHLFRSVCDAVQYAHRNLVVHRDLKPSNILVTADGVVKLLDFGIAKLLAEADDGAAPTRTLPVLTPEYAAPEQVRGQPVTTATDVYALGLLLYELLCGVRAQSAPTLTPAALERAICETDPPPPSAALPAGAPADVQARVAARGGSLDRLRRRLHGDLDTIVATALRKDPARRYASVDLLSADIERHLTGLPVVARADTLRYRTGKFLRRHRIGVAATAAVTLSLALGLGIAVTGLVRAQRAEERALDDARTAGQVSDFLVELFRVNTPGEARGNTVTARELLDRGAERVATQLDSQPVVQARLLRTMGQAYDALGLYDPALALFEQELDIERARTGERSAEVAAALGRLAGIHGNRGDYARSRDLARAALDIQEGIQPVDSTELATTLNQLGTAHGRLGELDDARAALERAFALDERRLGADHGRLASPLNNLAILHWQQGDVAAAAPLFQRALALWERDYGAEHPVVAHVVNNLALVSKQAGDFAQARAFHERALAIREKALPAGHPDIAESLNNLGSLLLDTREYDEARRLLERALELRERALGPDHAYVATTLNNLGFALIGLGDAATARPPLERAHAILELSVGADHAMTSYPLLGLARISRMNGELDDAERGFRRVIAIRRQSMGDAHPDLREAVRELADFLRARGRAGEAAELEASVGGSGAASQ